MKPRVKKLVSEIRREPWLAVEWQACRTPEIAKEVLRYIDDLIFAGKKRKALLYIHVTIGAARHIEDQHINCQVEACYGSVFRLLDNFKLAEDQMRKARELAESCDDCLGAVYKRWAAIVYYQDKTSRALELYSRSLRHFEEADDGAEVCAVSLARAAMFLLLERYDEASGDMGRAVELLAPTMPSRYHVATVVNALALAVGLAEMAPGREREALNLIETVKAGITGIKLQPRARAVIRWVRALAYELAGDRKNAIRCLESAISTFDRLEMRKEHRVALADLARIRRSGKQVETNTRHILRLIDESYRLGVDEETSRILEQARCDPSSENVLAWRASLTSYVPNVDISTRENPSVV